MKQVVVFLGILAVICLSQFTCLAAIIHVPADQPTIQAGIDAAVDGDTVLVADGTYTGFGNRDISFKGKAITVTSENGAENCIVDCNGTATEPHRGFVFESEETSDSILQGFTIQNGHQEYGGGIRISHASPIIQSCSIVRNKGKAIEKGPFFSWGNGGGIYCFSTNSSVITIDNCFFSDNDSDSGGAIFSYARIRVNNCIFTNNSADSGGAVYSQYYQSEMNNCKFINNTAANYGGGLYFRGLHNLNELRSCIIDSNVAEKYAGGGIYADGCQVTLGRSRISNNTARTGGAMYADRDAYYLISDCTVYKNKADRGGGIYCYNYAIIWILSSSFVSNESSAGKSWIRYKEDCRIVIGNCIIWNNFPYQLDKSSPSIPYIIYSDIQGGFDGIGNIDRDPMFTNIDSMDLHLSQNSPCVDSGTTRDAPTLDIENLPRPQGYGMDMGAYEYQGTSLITRTTIDMPSHYFYPGDTAYCTVHVWNAGNATHAETRLFVILEVLGNYYFAPSFSSFDCFTRSFPNGLTEIPILPEFTWPSNVGNLAGLCWYAALTNPVMTELWSEVGVFDFEYWE